MLRLDLVPKPKKFLNVIDLNTGVYIITLFTIINKLCGFYGLLAFLSGASISKLQMSMYFYSITALVFFCTSLEYISLVKLSVRSNRLIIQEDPFRILLFAYGFFLDSILNALYTLLFMVSWFLFLSQADGNEPPTDSMENPGNFNSSDISQTSSFEGRDSLLSSSTMGLGFVHRESISSLFAISLLWIIKAYFVIAVFSFARKCVRKSKTATESVGQHIVKAKIISLLTRGSYWNGFKKSGHRKFSHSEDPEDLEIQTRLMPNLD